MSIRHTFLGIVVLAISSVVFAQTTETKPPDVGSGAHARQSVEILTDTMGVDFGPYLKGIVPIVKQNWYYLMPPSVYPPILKQGKVSIEFVVLKDGTVSGMKVDTSSGNVPLDRAAWGSITASTPFHVLPTEFPGERLGLRFYFSYNPERAGDSLGSSQPPNLCHFGLTTISVSPCNGVQVPAGSTLKFAASGKDITDASVTWSISGSGCSKSDCGTISDTGLYTAPANIPNPPTVIVEATSRADASVTAKSQLTVVQANPSQ
ncbi:MAG TPA: TonB family protein [Terriglobales bacterium]|nr:TonB family protein [Terriglobales bacterium]